MYTDYAEYSALYGDDAATEAEFNLLSWDAFRKMDVATTGFDGVRKLHDAMPVDDYSVECVKRCACELIQMAYDIKNAEDAAKMAQGYTAREDGSIHGRVVSSITAGNESISYATSQSAMVSTLADKAMASQSVREQAERDIIARCMGGVYDSNGVPLLYMGPYPR